MGLEQAKAFWRKWFGKPATRKEQPQPLSQLDPPHTDALWPPRRPVDQGVSPDEALRRFKNTQERRQTALRRLSCPVPPFFSPEHEVTVRRRYLLDQVVPKAIQQSQTSTDLHILSLSDEAGKLPYCEDVAKRNLEKSSCQSEDFLHMNRDIRRSGRHQAHVGIPASEKLRDSTGVGRRGPRRHTIHTNQPHTRFVEWGSPSNQSRDIGTQNVFLPPLRADGQRRSLSHKANIANLKVASTPQSSSGFRCSAATTMPGNEGSSTSGSIRPCLDKALPPAPPRVSSNVAAEAIHGSSLRADRPGPDFSVTQDTKLCEQWLPAVTHHTIQQDIHEVREEHTEREIHNYHVYRRIQPVIEYQILPSRHFVHVDGGGYTEVSEDELPPSVPRGQWFANQISSYLEHSEVRSDHAREFDGLRSPDIVSERSAPRTEQLHVEDTIYEHARWEEGKIETPVFISYEHRAQGNSLSAL